MSQIGQDDRVRLAGFVAALGLLVAACNDDDESFRSFDLEGRDYDANSKPTAPHLAGWTWVTAVVIEAPTTVTAGEDVDVVIELRNPLVDPLDLDPCPQWSGGFGGDLTSIILTGSLPCDEIDHLDPGERIRLRLTVPSPPSVDFNEGGEYSTFKWRLEGNGDIGDSVAIPMREPS